MTSEPASRSGPAPRHLYQGRATSIDALAALAGVARRTMVRRLLVLTPDEAVGLGPVATGRGARSVNADAVPVRAYLLDGQPRSIAELAALAGCHVTTMRSRLDHGRTPEEAVADGPQSQPGAGTRHRWQGRPITAAELAGMAGCSVAAMQLRLHRGRTPEEAVALGGARSSGRPR